MVKVRDCAIQAIVAGSDLDEYFREMFFDINTKGKTGSENTQKQIELDR